MTSLFQNKKKMTSSSTAEVSLDMNKIAQSMKSRIEMLEPLSANCCIYIVPPRLRMANKEMYTPQIVSIGPFHHGNKELKAMEEHKLRYLSAFLDRISISIEKYYHFLKELEMRLRESYVQINGYTRKEFMDIMAVDGAFLMEYLLRSNYRDWEWNDRIFGKQFLGHDVSHDMLLTENQLPFFYLEYLFKLFTKSKGDHTLSLKEILQDYLSDVCPWKWSKDAEVITRETQVHHLLHFLILCLQPPQSPKGGECKSLATPSIWELHQAGVTFEPSSSSNCLSSINFSNGILEIPMLRLTDDVEKLFRNMQAFEQCHRSNHHINDYICIMDVLINKGEDVKVLVQNGIIDNWLEDDHAAATVFNNLGKGNFTYSADFSYSHVIDDVNGYYKMRRHKWKATLQQKYFNNPWTIISVAAAAFLLLLTIIQTVCSILEVL